MRVLLDTNVLTRIANGPDDPKFELARQSVNMLRQSGHIPCLVPQNLYEFWAVATKTIAANGLGLTTSEADAELKVLGPPLYRLLLDERAILPEWTIIVTQNQIKGTRSYDARLAAAAIRHGLSRILTFDENGFRGLPVTAVDPAMIISGAISL